MKNADMPAMPIYDGDNEIALLDHKYYWNPLAAMGLTKREMMAMHFHAALLTANDNGTWSGVDANAAHHAVIEADALLTELERTCQKS